MHFSNWQNKATAIWLVILLCCSIFMGWLWLNKDIHIQTNIFALLPKLSQQQDLAETQQYVNQQLNNKLFVVLDAADSQTLDRATQQLQQQIAQQQWIAPLRPQFNAEQFGHVLFAHRAGLLNTQDQQILQQKDYSALSEQSLLQVMSPGMPLTAQLFKQDPLLLFPRYVMGLAQHNTQNIQLEQGFATVHDGNKVSRLLVLELKDSPYNIDYQEKVSAWITQAKASLAKQQVTSHWTGTLIFTSFGTQSAQQEISTIGLGSSLGLIFLVWFGFRSLRPMLTEFITVTSGSLVALTVTHTWFGEIHLVTLVFGASLIGVCVDFSFYFMALQSQHRNLNGFQILKPLLPSLFMGLMTTVVAYLVLSFTPFPGFHQIAVFSVVGLIAAWITSILLLPRLPALNAEPAIERLHWIGKARTYFQAKTTLRYTVMAVILLVSGLSLLRLQSNDDIRNLQSMDAQLKQEDQYIRQRFAQQQASDYFVIQATSTAMLEQQEQTLIQQLQQLQQQGKLQGFQALGQWLPSQQQQQQNRQYLINIPKSELANYAEVLHLPTADVLAWQQHLAAQPLLTVQDFKTHPLYFLAKSPQQRLVLLQGIADVSALKKLQTDNIHLQQPIVTLSNMFKDYREHAQKLLLVALMGLAVGLGIIYGKHSILPLVMPVTLALLSTFAVQAWLGVEINVFSIMGTFLIIGIGVDYAIFYRHGHDHPKVVSMALLLCMLSTLLGFGLLSFSHTYAIHCFGLTVLLGVVFSFIYATLFTMADSKYQMIRSLKIKQELN
ncbi:hypothetical protein [Acinetobacter sp. MD2(2019)]|uniref:MMPL family transporter n=1 Tax=Acinetobacter sp. MD2(2019) TaxID=2605273 RepID=UPI002D1E7945|nr:hypothetical protein [Acinetobacter sp. MD2(2019)]MEB3753611.1 acyl-sn-glycerol-3-phosphate acyltransferase [Acinetobacter sp. MD2(2019)]